jgi:hypothetical protein
VDEEQACPKIVTGGGTPSGPAQDDLELGGHNWPLLLAILTGPFGLAVLFIIKHWREISDAAKAAWDFIRAGFRSLVLGILDRFGDIVHGAAHAFGWIPGLGDKLRTAAAAFDRFRDRVNAALGGVNGRTVHVGVAFSAAQSGHQGPAAAFRAAGGPVHGPGGPTADRVPSWLSDGEYVVKAASVRKYGKRMMDEVNAGRYASGGLVRGYASGGVVVKTDLPPQSVVTVYQQSCHCHGETVRGDDGERVDRR